MDEDAMDMYMSDLHQLDGHRYYEDSVFEMDMETEMDYIDSVVESHLPENGNDLPFEQTPFDLPF